MKRKNLLIIALLSLSLVSLELVWTRIFSAEFFYTFAFLVLSLAILGLGLGALAVRLKPRWGEPAKIAQFLILTGVLILVGPPLVFVLGLDFSQLFVNGWMVLKLVVSIFILGSAYFFGGIVLAGVFKNHHSEISKLYMADLLGAGFGVIVAILLMNSVGTPATTFLSALPVLVAAFIITRRQWKLIPIGLLLGMIFLIFHADPLLEIKRDEKQQRLYTHWDAMAKIKVFDYGSEYRRINIDNAANTGVNGFDGNWKGRPDSLEFGFNITKYVIQQFDSCRFLSLGAGGGQDVFQALQFGATDIHAVEVIPQLNYLLLEGELADFSGRIYHDPRVTVITEDARSYVRRFKNRFDVIYSFSSNSFAALASGAYALAENYLFTTEAFRDYWNALSDNGYLIMEHQAYMPRITSEVLDALAAEHVANPSEHIAIYNLPNMRRNMLLLSRQPLTEKIIAEAIGEQHANAQDFMTPLFPAADSTATNMINQIVTAGWRQVADTAAVQISPCTDNRPFIAQMGKWQNFNLEKMKKLRGYEDWLGLPLTQTIIVIILAVIILLIIPVNLLPYAFSREKLHATPWLYFFSIGMGFMIVEIILIQKYTFFIGPSVYSIVTILLTLLISSGIGSRFAPHFSARLVFGVIIGWLLLELFVFPHIISTLYQLPMSLRSVVTAVLILPLGFFMGMPFPKAAHRVGPLVDWGFSVNGAASVLGSTAIVFFAMNFGFQLSLAVGGLCYALALVFVELKSLWNSSETQE